MNFVLCNSPLYESPNYFRLPTGREGPVWADSGEKQGNEESGGRQAIDGRADALVTFNLKDFATAAERFGLDVIRPAELLARVKE